MHGQHNIKKNILLGSPYIRGAVRTGDLVSDGEEVIPV
jgi:hypothetical protein